MIHITKDSPANIHIHAKDIVYQTHLIRNAQIQCIECDNIWLYGAFCHNINSTDTNIYLSLHSQFDNALLHWVLECALFFPLFIHLKRVYPTIQMHCTVYKGYHTIFAKYFGIDPENIVYTALPSHNVCIIPAMLHLHNVNEIDEYYKQLFHSFWKWFDTPLPSKSIDILIMPRQILQNNDMKHRSIIMDDILHNLPQAVILNTDTITDLHTQIQMVRSAKCIIVTDGSPFFFNGLLSSNAVIIALGDVVISQAQHFKKYDYFLNLIYKHNVVHHIPYTHGSLENCVFYYNQIQHYLP